MNTASRSRRHAFTLIEVMVVIVILLLLAAIVFPAMSGAMNTGKKNTAAAEARGVASAVEMFYADYGYMPVPFSDQGFQPGNSPSEEQEQDQKYFTEDESKKIIQVLIAEPKGYNTGHSLNPRKKQYLDVEGTAADGTFEDPWGNQYRIKLDRDFNNKVEYYSDPSYHTVRAVVVSAGEPGWTSGDKPEDPTELVANVTLVNVENK